MSYFGFSTRVPAGAPLKSGGKVFYLGKHGSVQMIGKTIAIHAKNGGHAAVAHNSTTYKGRVIIIENGVVRVDGAEQPYERVDKGKGGSSACVTVGRKAARATSDANKITL